MQSDELVLKMHVFKTVINLQRSAYTNLITNTRDYHFTLVILFSFPILLLEFSAYYLHSVVLVVSWEMADG